MLIKYIDELPVIGKLTDEVEFPVRSELTTYKTNLEVLKEYAQGDLPERLETATETITETITELFDPATGHDHDGTNSAKIDYGNIVNTPDIDGKINNAIVAERLATPEWLSPVNTTAELQTTGLDNTKNYLCKVVADPVKSGVYQAVAGWTGLPNWVLYDDNVDLVNEQELSATVSDHNTDTTAHEDIRQKIAQEAEDRDTAIQTHNSNTNA